ncbi:hypothetical protein [Algirhabdus cladophorae]|uniref:hypothetical protein n=1 Tax=Algirhabdus cladophorae TaxID=3377108 RepID=UPI003B84A55F
MSDSDVNVKLAIIVGSVLGVIALGYVVVFVIVPAFLLAAVIDFGMRQRYNSKLVQVRQGTDLHDTPHIHNFDVRLVDQQVMIAWIADLPNGSHLDIYRVTEHGGGSVSDLEARGICIHSTTRELTNSKDELFVDVGLPDGTYFYVPVVSGLSVEREPLPYHFFDFARDVQFRTRRTNVVLRGDAVAIIVTPDVVEAIPDHRNLPARIADDVKAHIKQRRQFAADLDEAVAQIMTDDDFSEHENSWLWSCWKPELM